MANVQENMTQGFAHLVLQNAANVPVEATVTPIIMSSRMCALATKKGRTEWQLILTMGSNNRFIKCGLLNIQSVRHKTEMVRELINELSMDIFVLTETWMRLNDKPNNRTIIKKMFPSTHSFYHLPRPQDIVGGGVRIPF